MLDNYKEKQPLAYNILINEIKNKKVAHAYLIDENNYEESMDFVLSFVKELLCNDNYFKDNKKISKQDLCTRIDDGNYPELKIISPDGMFIKKQQIIDLQQDFSKTAIEGNKRIYIIRDADCMRPETANSMLKFLEEPSNDILAILLTNKINAILPTIVSRCQIIKLNNDNNKKNDLEIEKIAFDFICELEYRGLEILIKEKELLFDKISSKDRNSFSLLFDIMIDFYYDILKLKLDNDNISYVNYKEDLVAISNLNKYDEILNKIEFLINVKDSNRFNVNIGLLIDYVIVNVGGKYESSWS